MDCPKCENDTYVRPTLGSHDESINVIHRAYECRDCGVFQTVEIFEDGNNVASMILGLLNDISKQYKMLSQAIKKVAEEVNK